MKRKRIWEGLVLVLLCTLAMGMSVFAADTTMKNKKWVSGQGGVYVDTDNDGQVDNYQSYGEKYYKIQIPKQGYIVVDVQTSKLPGEEEYYEYIYEDLWGDMYDEDDAITRVALLDSKKKELVDGSNSLSDDKRIKFTAAVKKGTYYLVVTGEQKYKMRYSFTAVTKVSKSGKSLKKAVSLKRGKTIKSLITYDRDQYFKINLTEESKVTLSFQAQVRSTYSLLDGLAMQMFVKKGNSFKEIDEKGKLVPQNWTYWYDQVGKHNETMTWPAGTYYIRIFAWKGTGGGYYTMKWK